ncbi:hypothetical protein BJ878DRAFT_419084 [Calycina marina]|uniref:Fibronectin type-III domain-containing protein n=1 Tax=Calycina marina TaxID=1763456 RepID=A0A9P8CFT4_9HELO|nr:hypothetical protein BJ878DRAFT_419084 [Calycina marina]
MVFVQSLVTYTALIWILNRALQTIWKPVPELISILGYDVPEAPSVFLAGIKADAVTLHWTRPGSNKPVVKYMIQINGVNIGDSDKKETAITVTGLKPGHFYNIRVIAVGTNNFQAGSGVLRLRTYGRDGRPRLANGRIPSNLSIEDQQNGALADSSDESTAVGTQPAGLEPATVPEGISSASRDVVSAHAGQRRNTGGRKHSPSSAAADQAALAALIEKEPEETMEKLTERFESIRKETEELNEQGSKDMEESKRQLNELMTEKEEKKLSLKEREEASEKLKKEVNYQERANRQAQNRKSQAEKSFREKQLERTKMQQDMARWGKEIEDMKSQRGCWKKAKIKMEEDKEVKADGFRAMIAKEHSTLEELEDDIREKGLRLKELEEERKSLLGAQDNDERQANDAATAQSDREYESWYGEHRKELFAKLNHLRSCEMEMQKLHETLKDLQARNQHMPMINLGGSSGVDFDPTGSGKAKSRRPRHQQSRINTFASAGHSNIELQYATTYSNTDSPSFAPGLYFHHNSNESAMVPLSEHMRDMNEADREFLTAGAPLSPTAHSLLPSNIFADDDLPSTGSDSRSFGPALPTATVDDDVQSPASSSRSPSPVSSPHNSSQNLALYGVTSDPEYDIDRHSRTSPRGTFGMARSSNASEQAPPHRFGNMKDMFTRARGKTMQDGPALGSLKHGQSQSFPRSTDEPGASGNRPRRISFSAGFNMPSFLTGRSTGDGNAPAPARGTEARRRRPFNIFNSSIDDSSATCSDHDPSSPRPVSIASDLPRPSSDSAPFGWGPAADGNLMNRASPLATNWSVHAPPTWSRNPSRRPSIQHGSTTALPSGLVSDDDDILTPADLLAGPTSPTPIGIIGRPSSSHNPLTPRLNPAAPDFRAIINTVNPFSSKSDKGKGKAQGKEKSAESLTSTHSPTESRQDNGSILSQNSMAESQESLERTTSSNGTSEPYFSNSYKHTSFKNKPRSKTSSGSFGPFSWMIGSSVTNSESTPRDGIDEAGEEPGRSSHTGSPMLGAGKWMGKGKEKTPGTPKEGGRMSWSRFRIKDKKGRESLEVDRSDAEAAFTEDERIKVADFSSPYKN